MKSRLEILHEYVQRRQVLGMTVVPTGQAPEGKRRMDIVREALNEIANGERALLDQRIEQSRQSSQHLVMTLRLSFLGAAFLIGLVFYLFPAATSSLGKLSRRANGRPERWPRPLTMQRMNSWRRFRMSCERRSTSCSAGSSF